VLETKALNWSSAPALAVPMPANSKVQASSAVDLKPGLR
jgi:hypothetical protein